MFQKLIDKHKKKQFHKLKWKWRLEQEKMTQKELAKIGKHL